MNESVAERGGILKIIDSIKPMIEDIRKEPKILGFIDESAKVYIGACVNQPVAGIIEIANLVNIAGKPDIKSKLEAARALMAIKAIQEGSSKLGVGPAVEAELTNTMVKEVYNNYLKII